MVKRLHQIHPKIMPGEVKKVLEGFKRDINPFLNFKVATLVYPSTTPLPSAHSTGQRNEASARDSLRGMDDPNRARRQGEPPMHPSSSTRYMQDPLQARRSVPGGSVDRYNRPAPLNTSPAQGRAMGGAGSYSAYSNYSEQVPGNFNAPMAANTMHYQAGYGQDGRQQQSFGGYNAMPMSYDNIAGASYDPQSQFQRQPAGAPILPTDVPANSYFSNDPT
ncbi:hypothetical protein BN1723_018156, partial [Verticillium longisporum]